MKYVLLFVIIIMNISCSELSDKNILQNLISMNITNTGNTPVLVGNKINFKAVGIFKNNSEKDISNDIKWISSKTNIGTIDEKGIFTARNSGTTEIYTQYKDIESNSILIRVISEEGLNKVEILIKENPSVYEIIYDDSFLQTLGSAVLFPELNTTKTYLNHKTVSTQLNCNKLFSPGTRANGTNFY